MKTANYTLITFVVLFLLHSCNKKAKEIPLIKGVIKDHISRVPLEAVKILYYKTNQLNQEDIFDVNSYWKLSSIPPASPLDLDSVFTDRNGEFVIMRPDNNPILFPLLLKKDLVIFQLPAFGAKLSPGNSYSYTMDTSTYVHVNSFNKTPASPNDTLMVVINFRRVDLVAAPNNYNNTKRYSLVGINSGNFLTETSYFINQRAIIEWRVYNNGLKQKKTDTLNLLKYSLVDYLIEY